MTHPRSAVQKSKTPLGVIPADSELSTEELLWAFKQANPQVWAIKEQVTTSLLPLPAPFRPRSS